MKTQTVKEKKSWRENRKALMAVLAVYMILMGVLQCVALELSSGLGLDLGVSGAIRFMLKRPIWYFLAELALILLMNQILLLIFKRISASMAVSAFLSAALAVTNYFVYGLHGTPFTFSMIRNTGTALEVLFSYSLEFSTSLILILLICLTGILLPIFLFQGSVCDRKKGLIPTAILLIAVSFCYVTPHSLISPSIVGWSWEESVTQFGYLNCFVEATVQGFHTIQEPKDYDEEALVEFTQNYPAVEKKGQKPDVILILNETFFDLNEVTDIASSTDCLKNIHALQNAVTGHAVVPAVGGGTNKSEYEYLTGNTLQLTPNVTPFNALDLNDTSSVVTLLKQQGYETQAIHTEPGGNYNRAEGYPALGFDTVHFEGDFENLSYYGDRYFETDASVYENMFRWYEEMGPGPRLFYTLTIQNHGGYDRLSEEMCSVHTSRDFGENTHLVNEFMTMISMSDQAFQNIVDYFDSVDRDVIVCMVGDHAPAFIRSVTDENLTDSQREMQMRSVPYVIWSNHLDLSADIPETISMNYLMPTVIDMADIQLSPFYDYMISIRDRIPVLSAYGIYMTEDGQIHRYEDITEKGNPAKIYLDLTYANMSKKDFMKPFTAVHSSENP